MPIAINLMKWCISMFFKLICSFGSFFSAIKSFASLNTPSCQFLITPFKIMAVVSSSWNSFSPPLVTAKGILAGPLPFPRLVVPPPFPRLAGPQHFPRLAGPPPFPRLAGPPQFPRLAGPPQFPRLVGPPQFPGLVGPPQLEFQGPHIRECICLICISVCFRWNAMWNPKISNLEYTIIPSMQQILWSDVAVNDELVMTVKNSLTQVMYDCSKPLRCESFLH